MSATLNCACATRIAPATMTTTVINWAKVVVPTEK